MRVLALLPGIHERPTGGNLFNGHLLAYLEWQAEVERRVVDDPPADATADVTLIDSLLLGPGLRALPRPRVLLAHYLHVFEPGRRDGPEAARERRHLPRIDGVITTSDYCRDVLRDEGFAAERLASVMPGLDAAYRAETVAREPGPPRLLTVATLLEGKGLRQLAGVLEGLLDLPWTWEIAGDPGLDPAFATALRERLERSPLADRVRLHGAVAPERMVELYDRCHLFVLPSRFETCSMATMEAMARGLPVVAYRVGGIPERLPPESRAMLAPPGDREALGRRLRAALTDSERAAELGRANRRASRGFPTWEESGARAWDFLRGTSAR